jgi:hypothetical protein
LQDEIHKLFTYKDVGDPSALPALLEQVDAFDTFMADGAYDTEPSYQQIKQKSPDATCIIPPPKNAVKGDNPERCHDTNRLSETHSKHVIYPNKFAFAC